MGVVTGSITVTGPAATSGGPPSRRCVRVKQDNSKRTKCPGGGADLLKLLKRLMGIPVASSDRDQPFDGVFRVPIVSQDDGQGHSISINHGTVGEPQEGLTQHNETIFATPSDWTAAGEEVELELTGKLEFAPDTVTSAWLVGQALDSANNPILGAAVRRSGGKLITGVACHAQIAVSYNAYTTTQQVEITPYDGDGDDENYYQSSLVIQSACGGLERVKIDVPQCFEDFWAAWKDLLDEWNKLLTADGTGTVSSEEDEPEGADWHVTVQLCGKNEITGDSLGVYDYLKKDGKICLSSDSVVLCSILSGDNCKEN